MLDNKGTFCFTITDPRTREKGIFPGYKLIFDEKFDYTKEDLMFKVLLKNVGGKYVDVGIRDIHQPIEVYDSLLLKAGFKKIKKREITKGHDESYAVLYEVEK